MSADRWPVSVKGVLGWGGRCVVLRNERQEWELPGGRLELGDASPAHALEREMREELGIDVQVGPMIDSWIYDVAGKRVLIVTYACSAAEPAELVHSDEHVGVAALDIETLRSEAIPAGYLHSIETCSALLQ